MEGKIDYSYYDIDFVVEYEYEPAIAGEYMKAPEDCYPGYSESISWSVIGMTAEEVVIAADTGEVDYREEIRGLYQEIEKACIEHAKEQIDNEVESYLSAQYDYYEDVRKGL